jgi:biotin synthase
MLPQTADQPKADATPYRLRDHVRRLYELPFNDLLHQAQGVHRRHFNPNAVQLSTLMNIKSGGCPEDCAYCPQSAHYRTGVESRPLSSLDEVLDAARQARAAGATRFCMGAAWRSPKDRDLAQVAAMVRAVKAEGIETCATLGMLTAAQAAVLAGAGLDFYNHNLDTSPRHYREIIHTREYRDRLETLAQVRAAGMRVCCGGIVGMGESRDDRIDFLATLAALPQPPESVPINLLVRAPGTPLAHAPSFDPLELVRTIAVARLLMPGSHVRLSAGRADMPDTVQALCFLAGANSIFYGEQLLTTGNPAHDADRALLQRLGMTAES